LRSLRRTPLSRHSLIFAIASPRTKLPNSGQKRPSRRMTRVQKRFLVAIFAHRGRRATFECGDARSADGFSRNEPDAAVTAPASYQNAFAPDMLKEGPFLWPVDVPEAEIILVSAHLTPHHHNPPWCKTIGLSVIGVTQLACANNSQLRGAARCDVGADGELSEAPPDRSRGCDLITPTIG
jgi:hypothetical protein